MSNKNIVFIHLFNNFSGSPLVLSQVIDIALKKFDHVELITNQSSGFLDKLTCKKIIIPYKRYNSKIFTLMSFLNYQVRLFIKILSYRNSNYKIYINTTMPLAAAVAGKIIGKQIIFHWHETSMSDLQNMIIRFIVKHTSSLNIYVSEYLKNSKEIESIQSIVIYNSLSRKFVQKAIEEPYKLNKKINVLMVSSLRKFKGIDKLIDIANKCLLNDNIVFELVVDSTKREIKNYFNNTTIPSNLKIHESTSDIHQFYRNANILLNLTNRKMRVETFGMTVLEAMAYSIPSIVPTVGGPTELIKNEVNGYQIDSNDTDEVARVILNLESNRFKLQNMSRSSKNMLNKFDFKYFEEKINRVFDILLKFHH